ncbi:hypothetical protein MMC18_005084 [Xylographa bjoerkii]|nr:hypothetical protein [Xylographa bjoerkii]
MATNGHSNRQDGHFRSSHLIAQDEPQVVLRRHIGRQAGVAKIAETISLGILSLPSFLATIGIVSYGEPYEFDLRLRLTIASGLILILSFGCLPTYTSFVIGQFKLRCPHVHTMADAGEVMLGTIGREILGFALICFLIFIMDSHVLTFTIMMNVLTTFAICKIVYGIVDIVICLIFTIPRKLGSVSYMATAFFVSITAAVMMTMIGVGIENT